MIENNIRKIIWSIRSSQKIKNTLWLLGSLLIGVAMFFLLTFVLGPFGPMSRFPAAILMIYVGAIALKFIIRIFHGPGVLSRVVEEKNIAFSLVVIAYAIIIAAVLSTV